MRVCIVHNAYGVPSGEEAVVGDILTLLTERGHQVWQFLRSSAEIPGKRFGRIQAFFSGIYNPFSARAIRRLLAEAQPELVHVHNVYPFVSPAALVEARRAGIPVVMTVHNYRLVCPNGLHLTRGAVCERCAGGREYWCVLRRCEGCFFKSLGYAIRNWVARRFRFFLDNVTMYAALTEFQRQRLIEGGFPQDRITVIPNMVNGVSMSGPWMPGDYVGYAGRISPEKDVATLVEVARRNPGIAFRLAGALDRMPHLRERAPANLSLLGHLRSAELAEFYQKSRFMVLCSNCFEGFPTVLVQAMLHGKPILCSRIGGLPEIVEDGVTGLLFVPGDAKELAEKVRFLWERPRLCYQMGQAGRKKALCEYSPERYYERLMAVYRRAIELGPGGPCREGQNARSA